MGVAVGSVALQALLHRAQVEEQLALGLGRRDLDHAPVLQDVLVDFGLDPVQRVAHQAHALFRVEALDGLHQADVAFLDQVALRQAVTQVLGATPRPPGAGATAPAARRLRGRRCRAGDARIRLLLRGVSSGMRLHGRDVGVEVAERRHQRPRVAQGQIGRGGVGSSSGHGVLERLGEPGFQHISTLSRRVLTAGWSRQLCELLICLEH